MGPLTYFAPFVFALLGTVLAGFSLPDLFPQRVPWMFWTALVVTSLANAVLAQFLMIGAQGAFAQVMPVPWGRSIRGSGALLAGVLIILAVVSFVAAGILRLEELGGPALVALIIGGAATLWAIIIYVWNLPIAVRDFGATRD
jgi:hypothetical protein